METMYLFGAGINCYGAIKFFGKENIIAIVDNETQMRGNNIEGIPIIDFRMLLEKRKDEPIVITAFYKSEEIKQQLITAGITNYYVCPYMQDGFCSIEEIVDRLTLEPVDNFAVYGENILSQMLIREIERRGDGGRMIGFIRDRFYEKEYFDDHLVKGLDEIEQDTNIILMVEDYQDDIRNTLKAHRGVVIDIFKLIYDSIKNEHLELEKFHNIHDGRRCFVIGNGPSLRVEDLERLHQHNEICFASNKIYNCYGQCDWRPSYYVILDFFIFKNNYKQIREVSNENSFYKCFYNSAGMEDIPNTNKYYGKRDKDKMIFSDDITKGIYSGLTVTYDMLQIAVYMGIKQIYLLGVDFNYIGKTAQDGNHFYIDSKKSNFQAGSFYREENLKAYQAARAYAEANGIEIFNATRGGALDVFERVDFDTLF